MDLLRSAIALRKRCANWFQENATTEEDKIDNSNHTHFIDVLERVEKILEPNSVSESTHSDHSKTTATEHGRCREDRKRSSDKSINIYDVLYIDDDDSTTTPATATAPQNAASNTKTPPPPRKIIYELETTEEDAYFALGCLLFDLERLRHFLFDLWRDYDSKKLNLMTVSVTTNMAINLVRRAEQDLITSFPILKSFDEISKTLNVVVGDIRERNSSKSQSSVTSRRRRRWLWQISCICQPTRRYSVFCSTVKKNKPLLIERTDAYNPHRDQPYNSRSNARGGNHSI